MLENSAMSVYDNGSAESPGCASLESRKTPGRAEAPVEVEIPESRISEELNSRIISNQFSCGRVVRH